MTGPRRLLLGAAVAAGLAALVAVAPRGLRRLEFFRVRRVEFVGLRYADERALVARLALAPRASLFDPVAPLERRLAGMPALSHVAIRRRLPGTLVVSLEEAEPVGYAPGKAGLELVDSAGAPLPYDPLRSAPDLPVLATRDRRVAAVLGRLQASAPALFERVTGAARAGEDVALETEGYRVLLRGEAADEAFRLVQAAAQDLERTGRAFGELDGRFAGQVVVRRGGA